MGSDWPTTVNFGSDLEPDSDSSVASSAYYARQNNLAGKKVLNKNASSDTMDDLVSNFSFDP